MIYSWRYFDAASGLFHALILVFLAAMVGFSLIGDLFNMVVFFELMGAVAYALTAYKIEERAPIQGAINFAISNSAGAYAIFIAIALLYARTGALNMVQIGAALDGHHADALVIVAMTLLFIGFLTKAAAVPVHFWLADAHAVAPVPVCVLFSGVMVELGIYAVARLYWTIFAGALAPHTEELRAILVAFGTITALWGAAMCSVQRHIKRLLAFSTISHTGMFLCGIGLLSAKGLAGVAAYVVGHGLTKAALFMLAGVLMHRFATIDEYDLHGRGAVFPVVGGLFAIGGLIARAPRPARLAQRPHRRLHRLVDRGSRHPRRRVPDLPLVTVKTSIHRALAPALIASAAFAGCGAKPPQAPLAQAKKLDKSTSGLSTACGLAYQVTAFPGDHRRDLITLEATARTAAITLASVFQRNPDWIYQGETVAKIVHDATSMLHDCGLHATAAALAAMTSHR